MALMSLVLAIAGLFYLRNRWVERLRQEEEERRRRQQEPVRGEGPAPLAGPPGPPGPAVDVWGVVR